MASCAACGADNAAEARFCNRCGAKLAATPATGAAATDADRKQIPILFSELTDYTALSETLCPGETREIIATLAVPLAHEDDPVRVVRAALELHEAVAALSPAIEMRTAATRIQDRATRRC